MSPKPFLKWAGGKRKLLEAYEPYIPKQYGTYFEPFLGGGAMFFHLQPEHAILSDVNQRLVDCYRGVRDQPEWVICSLRWHASEHSRDAKRHYYLTRDRFNARQSGSYGVVSAAAQLIYLNRTCFNGLYRENKKGEFNVPMGSYKNPKICDEENLVACFGALRRTAVLCQHWRESTSKAQPGDFVFLDPPYAGTFTNYSAGGFDEAEQARMAHEFGRLAQQGTHVLLSNSDCELVRSLYAGWRIVDIDTQHSMGRKKAKEVLIIGEVA